MLLSGEPGIGKSRLVQTLQELTLRDGVTQVELHCSPYHQNSAYYPIIEHLHRFLRFTPHDTPQTKLGKLTEALASYRFPQAETLSLLATFLSLPHPEGSPPLTLSPQKQKEKTQEAIIAWIVEEAERAPVYCAWEDLHWVDPSTLDLLTLLLAQVPTARLLMLLTFRPEFTPPWGPRSYLSQLTLSRLGQSHVEAMVGTVTGGKALSPEILQQIVAKTDGVPLFVEELTKSVVETLRQQATGSGEQEGEFVGAQHAAPVRVLGIPTTLQDALMARLDRLGPAKEIAQMGATIGREFTYDVLQSVSSLTVDTLQRGLRQLVDAELLYQRGVLPQATYLFKHALVQDTAYQSLLKSTRQQLHQQIAQVLGARFVEIKKTQPELLAHHCTEAGLIEQVIPYWQKAGERATRRSANTEAVAHLTRGIELLMALPHTPERDYQELNLQTILGTSLVATRGYAASEVENTYTKAFELCQQIGETPQIFPILRGLRFFYNQRGELPTAYELGEKMLRLAQLLQDTTLLVDAHVALGATLFSRGELIAAQAHVEQGIALYDPQKHRPLTFLYGQDPGVTCLGYASWTLWSLGYPDQALKRSREALTLAEELSHPFSLAFAHGVAAMVRYFRRDWPEGQKQTEMMLALGNEQGFRFFLIMGALHQGGILAQTEKGKNGIEQLRQGLEIFQSSGTKLMRPYWLVLLAEAYGNAEQPEVGLEVLDEALAQVEKTGERFYEAELYRLKGELLLAQARQQATGDGQQGSVTDP